MIKKVLGTLFLAVAVAAVVVGFDVTRFFTHPLDNPSKQLVTIDPGMSFRAIMHRLSREHVLHEPRDAVYLSVYARLTGQASEVKSGEYSIPAHQTPVQLLHLLVSGKIRQHRLTIVPGWRFSEIMKAIESDDALKHTLAGKTSAQIMEAIGHSDQKAEGRFMPDTYLFPRGTTDTAFLKRAYAAMQRFLKQAWSKRGDDIAVKTPYQALTLASLIEKETAVPAERERISGVFTRRLKKGMRLQSDPTVIYGIKNYDGNIHKSDLEHDTPYNTYTRAGLPPTPICSPSRASIRAALHPDSGSAMYFVARGNGHHVFSDTLAEQNAAVRKYQLNNGS